MNIRCDQSTEGGNRRSLDTWIGRFAMLGFVAAIGIEISSGKGVLEVQFYVEPAYPFIWNNPLHLRDIPDVSTLRCQEGC